MALGGDPDDLDGSDTAEIERWRLQNSTFFSGQGDSTYYEILPK